MGPAGHPNGHVPAELNVFKLIYIIVKMLVGKKESKGDHKHEPTRLYVGVKLPKELRFRE